MKLDSLKNTAEFDFIYKNARRYFHKDFVLHAYPLTHKIPKPPRVLDSILARNAPVLLGLSISKKIGKAHTRNLLKRRIRAIVYENYTRFHAHALIIVARKDIVASDFSSLQKNLLYAFGKATQARNPSLDSKRPPRQKGTLC